MALAAHHPSLLMSLGIVALVIWRVYARVRRMVGRQKLSRVRPWLTVVIFPLLLALLSLGSLAHPLNLAVLAAGAALGGALGIYGLRLTTFEVTPLGRFYTPNAHLGIALSLLFVGRIVYRLTQFYFVVDPAAPSPTDFARSPLTLAIFGMLAGYYVAYAIGLIRWSRSLAAPPSEPL
jgi:hypothetical protein